MHQTTLGTAAPLTNAAGSPIAGVVARMACRQLLEKQCSLWQPSFVMCVVSAGDVINHGKHKFWGVPGMHYHQGMKAGENTLNALCSRLVTRTIAQYDGK